MGFSNLVDVCTFCSMAGGKSAQRSLSEALESRQRDMQNTEWGARIKVGLGDASWPTS
jgi:hypothetical protein